MYTPVIKRQKETTGNYISVSQRENKSDFSLSTSPSFFGTQTSTPAIYEVQDSITPFIKDVGRSIARNIGSAGLSFTTPFLKDIPKPLTVNDFQTPFVRGLFQTVFGEGEEIKPIETRIVEMEPRVQKWGEELDEVLVNPNLSFKDRLVVSALRDLSKKHPGTLAFLGVMGSVGLDLAPFGGLERGAYKAMVKVKTVEEAVILLGKLGVADDLVKTFADDIVKVAKEVDAEKLFKSIANLQQTTKVAPKALKPLAQEARKYKSAEELLTKADNKTRADFIKNYFDVNGLKVDKVVRAKLDDGFYVYHEAGMERTTGYRKFVSQKGNELTYEVGKKKLASDFIADDSPMMLEMSVMEGRNRAGINGKITKLTDFYTQAVKGVEKKLPERLPSIKRTSPSVEYFKSGIEIGEEPGGIYKKEIKRLIEEDLQIIEESVFSELENARAGTRITLETGEVKGIKSTFPQWVPEELRTTKLFNEALENLRNGTLPKEGSKVSELVDIVQKEISTRIDPQFLDEKILFDLAEKHPSKVGIIKRLVPPSARKILGQELPKKITLTETQLLKGQIRAEARTAKAVAKEVRTQTRNEILTKLRATTQATNEIKNDIVKFVKENLDTKDRGKALTIVRDAKTQKDITKAFARINRWAEDAEKITVRNEILKTQKKIMDSPSIAIDYKARIKELMGDFELKGHREDTLERLRKTQEFLQQEAAKGNDIEVPRRVLKSLELLNRTPFEEITMSQLKGLQAEMELLENLGRTKFRTTEAVWEIQKGKILEDIITQGAEPIKNIELIKPEIGERLTLTQKFKNLIWRTSNEAARIDKAISPMDTIFDLLDGGKGLYDGPNFRYFKGQVDAGHGRYLTRKDALQEPVIELANKYKLEDINFERMGVVAAREQDKGIEKLIASGFTQTQIDAVKLTAKEQEVLDLMRKTFDSQFPEIQDTMRLVYNQPVEKVKNYFSFMTDWKAMDEAEVFQRFGSQLPEQYGAPRKNVEAGFTKTRVGGDQKIKINALDVFLQHTDNTSYLLELGETSKMLGEVAASPKYAELVGDVGQLMVREWLDVIARKGGAAGASEIAILNTIRKNVGIGILGMKLSTIAIQPTAFIDGMGFIGTKYGRKGFVNFTTSSDWRKFVGNMPEIKDRMGGEFALRELTDDNWLQGIQRKGFVPMQTLDQMTAGAIVAGAYERKMIELGQLIDLTKGYNDEALAYAQLAVRRTQSSGAFKDVPLAISRGALTGNRSLDRAILQFQNFLLTRWSRIRHDAIRAGINTKDPRKAIPVLMAIIAASLAASGIRLGVNKTIDFITGREDEDEISEDLAKGFVYEMTGNVPFLGTAVSMAMYDGEMFPLLDAPKGIISGLNRVVTSESEGAKLRGFTEFAGSTGALLGIPGSAQAEQLARGFLQEEKAIPKGKKPKLPPGFPALPSLKKPLPTPPGLPAFPK